MYSCLLPHFPSHCEAVVLQINLEISSKLCRALPVVLAMPSLLLVHIAALLKLHLALFLLALFGPAWSEPALPELALPELALPEPALSESALFPPRLFPPSLFSPCLFLPFLFSPSLSLPPLSPPFFYHAIHCSPKLF